MATRSTIAQEYSDGTVRQIYCHSDGYPEWNGQILDQHYADPSKLKQLIDLGDLSSLGQSPEENSFYCRDWGEKGPYIRHFKDVLDYAINAQTEEFNYLLNKHGVWLMATERQFETFRERHGLLALQDPI